MGTTCGDLCLHGDDNRQILILCLLGSGTKFNNGHSTDLF